MFSIRKVLFYGVLVLVIVIFALASWRLVSQGPGSKIPTAKIAFMGPLTGSLADYGIPARNGVMLAAKEINTGGQMLVEIVSRDTEGDADKAREIALELAQDPEILGVVGTAISSTALSAGEVFQDEGLVMISYSATSPKLSELGDFIFRTCPSDAQQGRDLAQFAVRELGAKKVAIMIDMANADYSAFLADVFAQEIAALDGEVVAREEYSAGDTDFSTQLSEIGTKNPELLFIPGYTREGALIAQAARRSGLTFQILGGDGLAGSDFISLGGTAVEGAIVSSFFYVDNPDPEVKIFVDNYHANYGEIYDWSAAYSYDALKILAAAIQKVGSDREAIRDELAKTDFEGVTGSIVFDENGDVAKEILKMVVRDAKFEVYGQ